MLFQFTKLKVLLIQLLLSNTLKKTNFGRNQQVEYLPDQAFNLLVKVNKWVVDMMAISKFSKLTDTIQSCS